MKKKYLFSDPSLYAVIAMNVYLIYEYQQNADNIHTILIFYWIQNVLIGLFNFLDILTIPHIKKGSFPSGRTGQESRGCSAVFFLVHYGGFQLGYFFYLLVKTEFTKINWHYIYISFWILTAGMGINFIRNKIRERQFEMNLSTMFFLPYLRIVPMHLMIFAPMILHISSFASFLILKAIFDVLMHILSNIVMMKEVRVGAEKH